MCLWPKRMRVTASYPIGEDIEKIITNDGEIIFRGTIDVPCGECLECLEKYSTVWAHRVMDEMKQHLSSCFITLTYNPEHNPGQLVREDLQKFIKRLRKHVSPQKIRYFYCGEYGSKGLRPHYHIMIFGWKPDDLRPFKKGSAGDDLYLSETVSKLWQNKGFITVGAISIYTAKYSAKYLQKLQKTPQNMTKPFTGMSTKPGIGFYNIDPQSLNGDRIYHDGAWIRIPRYYLNKLELAGYSLDDLRALRNKKAIEFKQSSEDLKIRRDRLKLLLDNKVRS